MSHSRDLELRALAEKLLFYVRLTPGAEDGDIRTAEDTLNDEPVLAVMSCLDRLAWYKYRVSDDLYARVRELCAESDYMKEDYEFFVEVQEELRSAA